MKKSLSVASFIVVGLLLHAGIGFAASADFSSMSSKELNNALVSAVEKNKPEAVQELVQLGADVNQEITTTGSHGRGEGCMDYMTIYTLLEYAAVHDYVDIVKALIKAGAVMYADHREYSNYGPAALIGASSKGHVNVVRALIKAGADVNHPDRGDRALPAASRGGHIEVVKELIKAGAHVNFTDEFGRDTVLIGAAKEGRADVVRELIKAGAHVNATNAYDGNTALIGAAKEGRTDVVRELIKAGAHVNIANKNGDTALIEASIRDQADAVRELIKAGAHVNITNKNGDTALMCAIKNHHFDAVQSILQSAEFNAGIWQQIKDSLFDSGTKSINYADKDGNTALILAVKYARSSYIKGDHYQYKACINSQKILNALLETHGADFHHVNKKGETIITLLNEFKKKSSGYSYL